MGRSVEQNEPYEMNVRISRSLYQGSARGGREKVNIIFFFISYFINTTTQFPKKPEQQKIKKNQHIHKVQSSPGYLHVGHVPSNCTRQMPQTSSSGMSQRHEATAFHSLIVTFILFFWEFRIWNGFLGRGFVEGM